MASIFFVLWLLSEISFSRFVTSMLDGGQGLLGTIFCESCVFCYHKELRRRITASALKCDSCVGEISERQLVIAKGFLWPKSPENESCVFCYHGGPGGHPKSLPHVGRSYFELLGSKFCFSSCMSCLSRTISSKEAWLAGGSL